MSGVWNGGSGREYCELAGHWGAIFERLYNGSFLYLDLGYVAVDEKARILPYRSRPKRVIDEGRPKQTPVRNQIAAGIYSIWVVLKRVGAFLSDVRLWFWIR